MSHEQIGSSTQLKLLSDEHAQDPLTDHHVIDSWPTTQTYILTTATKDISYQSFSFCFCMLPSINEKHDRRQRVRPMYRQQELREIARIALQRDMVAWQIAETDRYTIFYTFTVATWLKQDIHNFLKPTCDLFGDGRWQASGSRKAKSYRKSFVPHARVIWNDNRVMQEHLIKNADRSEPQWCYVTIFRYNAKDQHSLYLQSAINDSQSIGQSLKKESRII